MWLANHFVSLLSSILRTLFSFAQTTFYAVLYSFIKNFTRVSSFLTSTLDSLCSKFLSSLPSKGYTVGSGRGPLSTFLSYAQPQSSTDRVVPFPLTLLNLTSATAWVSTAGVAFIGAWEYSRSFTKRTFGFGFYHIQGLFLVLSVDAMLTDDEPLWEPIEWSLVQSWILFIFAFAWIAENLIVSRFGSYTGRDKRVWFAWYKSFWMIEGWYIISYGAAVIFVIVPFYYETNYNLAFVFSWWHWYSRVFFFKFISLFTLVLLIAYTLQMSVRWLSWRKGLILVLLVNMFLGYLLYTHFIMTFFGYFTDPVWYQKTRPVDYVQLSHEPGRWGWGGAKKDHFTYHNVRTVFWFKNDGPFAASFLLFHLFMWLCMFFLSIFWITLFRRIYTMQEIPLTYTTYCVSSLKQFLYFFLILYVFIFASYVTCYARFPIEFLWTLDTSPWLTNFLVIAQDYPKFVLSIFTR